MHFDSFKEYYSDLYMIMNIQILVHLYFNILNK